MPTPPLSDGKKQAAVDAVARFGSVSQAARETGISRETLQSQYQKAVQCGFKPRVRVKAGSSRGVGAEAMASETDPPVPMSEDQRKFHADWGPEECIAELRRIAQIDTDKVVTRNYFRVHSDISESTWSRYFGSFLEFKRQAEIILSRHAHRMERDIAKHASVDKLRTLNVDKRQWEGAYDLPSSRRWQTAMVINDIHDKECDPFYRRVVIDTARRVQPEKLIFNGDLYDLPEFSKHTQDPRSFQLIARIQWVHEFLSDLREAAPNTEFTLVAGNHEERLLRHLAEETPAMMVVLADLHGFTVSKLLGLEKFEVNFVSRADMTAFTERDIKAQLERNTIRLWDCQLYGHFPHMRNLGMPGASGHHHSHFVWSYYSEMFGPYEWHQVGAGHRRRASYCSAEKWSNGFLLAHADTLTKRSQFEYIDLSHDAAFVGGKHYQRDEREPVLDLVA
jgi:hypothetical protein